MLEIRAIHPTWMFEFDFAKGTTYTIYMLLLCLCNSIKLERICFCLLLCVFDALLDNWKDKLIGISSDTASIMAGALSGVDTPILKLALSGLYCVLCCSHQMDLVVQKAIAFLYDKNFVSNIMGISGHLNCQGDLISEMQSKGPHLVNTSWLSMEQLLPWLTLNRPCLTQHFNEK